MYISKPYLYYTLCIIRTVLCVYILTILILYPVYYQNCTVCIYLNHTCIIPCVLSELYCVYISKPYLYYILCIIITVLCVSKLYLYYTLCIIRTVLCVYILTILVLYPVYYQNCTVCIYLNHTCIILCVIS